MTDGPNFRGASRVPIFAMSGLKGGPHPSPQPPPPTRANAGLVPAGPRARTLWRAHTRHAVAVSAPATPQQLRGCPADRGWLACSVPTPATARSRKHAWPSHRSRQSPLTARRRTDCETPPLRRTSRRTAPLARSDRGHAVADTHYRCGAARGELRALPYHGRARTATVLIVCYCTHRGRPNREAPTLPASLTATCRACRPSVASPVAHVGAEAAGRKGATGWQRVGRKLQGHAQGSVRRLVAVLAPRRSLPLPEHELGRVRLHSAAAARAGVCSFPNLSHAHDLSHDLSHACSFPGACSFPPAAVPWACDKSHGREQLCTSAHLHVAVHLHVYVTRGYGHARTHGREHACTHRRKHARTHGKAI